MHRFTCIVHWGQVCSKVFTKQLLTYLKLTGLKLGFLLNFGEELIKHGITRTINGTLNE